MNGAIWVANGKAHIDTAIRSSHSFKLLNPSMKTALFTDSEVRYREFDFQFAIPEGTLRPKIDMLACSPFEKTIYFDNDTIILKNLDPAYEILDSCDIAGCHVLLWHRPRHNKKVRVSVPTLFPEINCGVLVYKKSIKTTAFIKKWSSEFKKAGLKTDQTTFRECLWESDLKFLALPEQMNKRFIEGCEVIYSDKPKPYVVHLPALRPAENWVRRIQTYLVISYWKRTSQKGQDDNN